ncbi:hypothetical protein TRV_04001 [Trichophyton verrucosum HKI 0517]|uniref:Uncharacterized protein n=1 Tax=Trichophyton verrucosum (strain HKI 0517) TaxID=663202 RepID=D4DA57_TRIVH|nr:uncharacterized protein TRV_04001 [Trichophyton verrucosum HKI 0517]EFE41208.1 hypothetical protein TRV_04001 [Trichophyton verrucosum HKI 0517]
MVARLYKGSRRREKKRDMALQEEEEKTTVKNRPLNCAVEVKKKKETKTRRTRQAKRVSDPSVYIPYFTKMELEGG